MLRLGVRAIRLVTLPLVTLAVAGCARPTTDASPSSSPRSPVGCEHEHGAWRPGLRVCDIQGGGAM